MGLRETLQRETKIAISNEKRKSDNSMSIPKSLLRIDLFKQNLSNKVPAAAVILLKMREKYRSSILKLKA